MGETAYNFTGSCCPENPDWDCLWKRYRFAPALSEELKLKFRNPEQLLREAELVKNSRSTTAGIFTADSRKFFIKRSNTPNLTDRLRRIGRRSRAEVNLKITRLLGQLGIRAPEVLMTLSTAPCGLPGASYLVTEYFPEPMNAAENLAAMLASAPLENWVGRMTRIMVTLHDAGIAHGDLKLVNWLALPDGNGDFELGLFDFDGTAVSSDGCDARLRRKELARVVSSLKLELDRRSLLPELDIAELNRLCCEHYAVAGGPDFSGDGRLLNRVLKFLQRQRRKGRR